MTLNKSFALLQMLQNLLFKLEQVTFKLVKEVLKTSNNISALLYFNMNQITRKKHLFFLLEKNKCFFLTLNFTDAETAELLMLSCCFFSVVILPNLTKHLTPSEVTSMFLCHFLFVL